MLLFYLDSLREFFVQIDKNSTHLRKFASVTNEYFTPRKNVSFNPITNLVSVIDSHQNEVRFDDLSSGEKQIIAFFTFLSVAKGDKKSFLIVDEPELSLSVDWQLRLISDMISVSEGGFLLVATHSPFIFEKFGLNSVIEVEA